MQLAQYGESHLIMIKNAEHSLATGVVEVIKTVSAFAHDICAKRARPTMVGALDMLHVYLLRDS
jgi:hypothetical protein